MEQVVHIAGAHLGGLLMSVIRVLDRGMRNEAKMRKEGRTGCRGRVAEPGGWGVEAEVEMGLFTTWVGGLPM